MLKLKAQLARSLERELDLIIAKRGQHMELSGNQMPARHQFPRLVTCCAN